MPSTDRRKSIVNASLCPFGGILMSIISSILAVPVYLPETQLNSLTAPVAVRRRDYQWQFRTVWRTRSYPLLTHSHSSRTVSLQVGPPRETLPPRARWGFCGDGTWIAQRIIRALRERGGDL
jgi:hypothetical protein